MIFLAKEKKASFESDGLPLNKIQEVIKLYENMLCIVFLVANLKNEQIKMADPIWKIKIF